MAGDGDFLAILRFVARVVQWLLELTLDLLCVCALLPSLLLPWRCVALFLSAGSACKTPRTKDGHLVVGGETSRTAFRKWAALHLFAALVDLISVPLALIAFLAPTRCSLLVRGTKMGLSAELKDEEKRILYHMDVRRFWLRQFFLSLLDVFCFVFALVAIVHPWRTFHLIRGSVHIATMPRRHARYFKDASTMECLESLRGQVLGPMRSWWFLNFVSCFVDWPVLILGTLSALMPTRTCALFHAVCCILKDGDDWEYASLRYEDVADDVRSSHYTDGTSRHPESIDTVNWFNLWSLCLWSFAVALLDFATLPFSFLALISPLRCYHLVNDIYLRRSTSPPKCGLFFLPLPASEVVLRKTWKRIAGRHVYQGSISEDGLHIEFKTFFESESSSWCLVQRRGSNGVENLVAKGHCPPKDAAKCLSPDCVEIWTVVSDSEMPSSGMRNCYINAKWGFGGEPIENSDLGIYYNQGLRLACVRHGAQALVDILFLPFMLLTFLSVYRARPLIDAVCNMTQRKAAGSSTHDGANALAKRVRGVRTEALRQSLLLLLDILIMPALILVLLTGYRSHGVRRRMCSSFNHLDMSLQLAVLKNSLVLGHDLLLLVPFLCLLCTLWRAPFVCSPVFTSLSQLCSAKKKAEPSAENREQGDAADEADEDGAAVARRQLAELDPEWAQLAGIEIEPPAEIAHASQHEPSFPGTFRIVVWTEFAKLLRDFLFLLIALLTLYRLPSVLLKLCMRAGRPLEGEPMFITERAQMKIIDRGGASIQLTISGQDALILDRGSLKIRPVGKAFWEEVASTFGPTKAALAQGLMPLRLDAKQTDAYDVLASSPIKAGEGGEQAVRTISIHLDSKMKRTSVLKSLQKLGNVSFQIQLEGTSSALQSGRGRSTAVLVAATIMRIHDLLPAASELQEGEFADLPKIDDVVEVGKYIPVQDALWSIVTMEFVQILLDLVHILLFVPILCVPWRLVALVICLSEPKERWYTRLGTKAFKVFRTAEWLLDRFKSCFVPHCNELLKDRAVAHQWHNGGSPPLLRLQDLVAHGAVSRGLCSAVDRLSKEAGQLLEYNMDLQDARLYYVALRAYAHCALSMNAVSVEEHATILEEISKTEIDLSAVQQSSKSALERTVNDAHQAATSQGCRKCGFWRKDLTLLRSMVRALSAAALTDISGFVLCLLLVLTVYRLPIAIAELFKEGCWNPTRNRFRIIVICHLRAFAEEALLALQVLLLTVLLVATCIRLPEAVHSMGSSTSLRELRDNLWQDFIDALQSLWQLLSLFKLWRTYSLIFRSVAQSLLVPPACLSELIGLFCSCLPLGFRFALGFILMGALIAIPFAGSWGVTAFFYAMVALLLGACLAVARRPGDATIQGWSSPVIRWSWANAIALATVFVEPALICMALVSLSGAEFSSVDPTHGVPLVGLATCSQVCNMVPSFAVTACSLTAVWLLLLSLMFVTGQQDEHAALQKNPLLRFLQLLLSHTLSVPICLSLLLPTACSDPKFMELSLAFFALYACTTQALSTECGLLEPPPQASGLDLRYPSRYIAINQALNIGICIACVCQSSGDMMIIAVLAATQFLYAVLYPCMSHSPVCSVPYVVILRLAGALAVLTTTSFILYKRNIANLQLSLLLYGLLGLLCLALLAAMIRAVCAQRARRRDFQQSGILDECRKLLLQTEEAMCDVQAVLGRGQDRMKHRLQKELLAVQDPQSLALQLVAFERHTLVEWLTFEFLENRSKWRRALLYARDFSEVRNLILQLRAGFQTPPTQKRLLCCVSKALGRTDLADRVVDYVVGHEELKALIQPALFCAKSAKKPSTRCGIFPKGGRVRMGFHFSWAHRALQDVLDRFKETTRNSTIPGLTETEIGHSRMNTLNESSAPRMYWQHLASMLQHAGRLLDRVGEPHVCLPRGLVVNRVLPSARSSISSRNLSNLAGSTASLEPPRASIIQGQVIGQESDALWAPEAIALNLEASLDVHPSTPLQVANSPQRLTLLDQSCAAPADASSASADSPSKALCTWI